MPLPAMEAAHSAIGMVMHEEGCTQWEEAGSAQINCDETKRGDSDCPLTERSRPASETYSCRAIEFAVLTVLLSSCLNREHDIINAAHQ